MEGAGSRLGRASSRYGAGPSPVFSGPVRKWKKQWVNSQPNSNLRGNGKGNNTSGPTLILCRWIPLRSDDSNTPDDTPKRKFRYAPIVDLEEKKKMDVEKDDDEANRRKLDSAITSSTSRSDEILQNINDIFGEDFQELSKDHSDTK